MKYQILNCSNRLNGWEFSGSQLRAPYGTGSKVTFLRPKCTVRTGLQCASHKVEISNLDRNLFETPTLLTARRQRWVQQ